MFLDIEKKDPQHTAIIDNLGTLISYGGLREFSETFYSAIQKRCLIFILCEDSAGALAAYVSCLDNRVVPLMVSAGIDPELLEKLISVYHPEYLWVPQRLRSSFKYSSVFEELHYALLKTDLCGYELYNDLALLLTTSGSTGSAKYVRHSYKNIISNAQNVASVFELNEQERGMVSLPLQFTQGLNVATSHLLAGATVLLSTNTLIQKEFWDFFKQYKATSMTCVPYSVELLDRLRFFRMDLPYFKVLNQGGGRLPDQLFRKCADYAHDTGRKFIPTYGSTETTSRMAYLPAELSLTKCGSIGRPLPGCSFELLDDSGRSIDAENTVGEIVFKGPNVTLGYAECGDDLKKGDERLGVYCTGDLAYFDSDGCYFIVGRKKRFVKIFGYRVSLDEIERLVKDNFQIECACVGTDKKITIFTPEKELGDSIIRFLSEKTNLHYSAFSVRILDSIPKNDTGKTQYRALEAML